jgi:hypothetical protein
MRDEAWKILVNEVVEKANTIITSCNDELVQLRKEVKDLKRELKSKTEYKRIVYKARK